MSSLAEVPVFYLDQDETWERPCCVVTRNDARQLKKQGAGKFILHGRAFRLHDPSPAPELLFDVDPANTTDSNSSISLAECLANVGIGFDRRANPSEIAIYRAQEKVRCYPHVGDDLAILARGSWVFSKISIAVEN